LGHHQCMTQLSPQRVTAACLELLRRHSGSEVRHAG
jgi:hypothetical protein